METYWINDATWRDGVLIETIRHVSPPQILPGPARRGNDVELGVRFTNIYTIGRDCWLTMDEGLSEAERRRQARIDTLRRQADALEATPISVSELGRARA